MPARHAAQTKARPDESQRRVLIVAFLLVAWMFIIGARLVHLQLFQHQWLSERARVQQQNAVETSPLRGLVLDREGRELARSIDTESFFAVPQEIKNVDELASRLSPLIGADATALAARLKDAQANNKKFAWLARKLDEGQAASIRALNLDGIHSTKEPKRFYPNGALASHVLGFVNLDEVGIGGVEQFYNAQIRGEAGKVLVETDAKGRPYESFDTRSHQGQSVVLSIDQTVQYWTEQALASAVERTQAKSATAIVLDPHTGDILALANLPTFDPNDPRGATPEARANGALQYLYEPGSTFKIVAYSAAIEKGYVKPDDKIDCQMGSITVAGRLVHDHHPFGVLTIANALAQSSNVAAIKLGIKVGDPTMYDYIRNYGFGSRTGVELPGETAGLVRPVQRWQASSIGSIAIGQEVGVTPLQMAAAFATLANDGVRVAPHLVREIRAGDGTTTYQAQPEQRRVISTETARALRGMLEGVTLNGTAKKAQLDGYTAAGKTGTAQKFDSKTHAYSKTKYVGSFVGFAPVDNPAVVIIVVIDEPAGSYHGGDVAAPVFREIAERILPGLGVEPDTKAQPAPGSNLIAQGGGQATAEREAQARERQATLPQVTERNSSAGMNEVVYTVASKRAVLMPDLTGRSVRDAARICAQLGLQLEARGEGRARRQSPQPGAELGANQIVHIEFGRSD